MKKINILLFLAVLFLGLNSCSDDDKETTGIDETNKLVKLQSTINSLTSVENADSLWVKNTMLGVYGLDATSSEALENASNVRYFSPKGKSEFGPANMYNDVVTFPANGGAIDVIAYRPYNAAVENGKLNLDLTKQGKPVDIDLMYSNNIKGLKQGEEAVADFAHVLSKMIIRIHLGDAVHSVVGMDVKLGNFVQKGAFDILAGSIVKDDAAAVGSLNTKLTFTSGVSYAEAIVFPNSGAGRTLNVRYGKDAVEIAIPATLEMKANKQYTFDLTVNKAGFVLADQVVEEDWLTDSAAKIVVDPQNTGNGEVETPFHVYQTKEQVSKKESWVAGIITDFKFPDVKGEAGTDYIVLKDVSESADSTKYLLVDLKNSPVADRLATSLIPDLIGMRVNVKADIVVSEQTRFGVKLENVVAEKGGGPVSGPVTELLFMETFGWPAPGQENDRPQLDTYEGYDMKSPIVYNVLDVKRASLRYTNSDKFGDYGFYIWMDEESVLDLSIENIQSKDYYDLKLMYDMANGDAQATYDILAVKCNGVEVKLPATKVKKKDNFETVSVKIPNGTTNIQIIKPGKTSGNVRVDNVRIEGTIVK